MCDKATSASPTPVSFIHFSSCRKQFSVMSLLQNESTNCIRDPTRPWSHLGVLGSWGLWWRLSRLIFRMLCPAGPRQLTFLRLTGDTFLGRQARQASFRLDMHNFHRNQPTASPSATRHSPVLRIRYTVYGVIVQYFGTATAPGLKDKVPKYRAERCVMMIYCY